MDTKRIILLLDARLTHVRHVRTAIATVTVENTTQENYI